MAYRFDEDTKIYEIDQLVFDWMGNEDKRVRVQASRLTVEDTWGIPWSDKAAVRVRFDEEKRKHLPLILEVELLGGRDSRFTRSSDNDKNGASPQGSAAGAVFGWQRCGSGWERP
jgi:hypothetical protein